MHLRIIICEYIYNDTILPHALTHDSSLEMSEMILAASFAHVVIVLFVDHVTC